MRHIVWWNIVVAATWLWSRWSRRRGGRCWGASRRRWRSSGSACGSVCSPTSRSPPRSSTPRWCGHPIPPRTCSLKAPIIFDRSWKVQIKQDGSTERRPLDVSGSSVDSQNDQSLRPRPISLLSPNVRVAILHKHNIMLWEYYLRSQWEESHSRAGDDLVRSCSPVDASDPLWVLLQSVQQLKTGSVHTINANFVVVVRQGDFCKKNLQNCGI